MTSELKKYLTLPSLRRVLLREALVRLVWHSILLKFVPYPFTQRRIRQRLSKTTHGRHGRLDHAVIADIRWAVETGARTLPFSPTCLVQALAAQDLLRIHLVDFPLQIGTRMDLPRQKLQAHAWIECEGVLVAGSHPELESFSQLIARGGRRGL